MYKESLTLSQSIWFIMIMVSLFLVIDKKKSKISLKGILLKIRRLMLSAVEFEVCILYDVYGINHIIDTLRFGENDFDYFNIEIF